MSSLFSLPVNFFFIAEAPSHLVSFTSAVSSTATLSNMFASDSSTIDRVGFATARQSPAITFVSSDNEYQAPTSADLSAQVLTGKSGAIME